MSDKIFPRNLTARAERRVTGNPDSTRLESGVANCFPGLEFDHRNLDRRFFPGLVFDFNSNFGPADLPRTGARLVQVDTADPDLNSSPDSTDARKASAQALRQALSGSTLTSLGTGNWFLDSVAQGGRKISLSIQPDGTPGPQDGLVVWRLVRGLEPGLDVEITLVQRSAPSTPTSATSTPAPAPSTTPTPTGPGTLPAPAPLPSVTLKGWRRDFTNKTTGVISTAYGAGELTQSLCSPWQHDFRDCACHYWASNHPDVVLAEDRPTDDELPSGESADALRAEIRIDWLRSDRDRARAAAAIDSFRANRPFQMDHYEINQRWEELSIVLGGKETPAVYLPRSAELANPFESPEQLAEKISQLATLEHVLALEYLYALYSIKTPEETTASLADWPHLRDDVTFVRHFVLLVAVSEMLHLRWANQLLWELADRRLIPPGKYGPQLGVADRIPVSAGAGRVARPRALRPLTRQVLADFVAVEQPSGFIEGQYARVTATLRQPAYPAALYQLASRIVNEGMDHFERFRDIGLVLRQYPEATPPYLRAVRLARPDDPSVKDALTLYQSIISELTVAYATGRVEERSALIHAREAMTKLDTLADDLAGRGIGIPFFQPPPPQ
jgi:hypothetical protein